MREALVVFGKSPEPGRVKTRLAVDVGEEMAARLYEAFARDVFEVARRYGEERGGDGEAVRLILAWDGPLSCPLANEAIGGGFELVEQGTGDLGERLKRVAEGLRRAGVEQIIVVGTDSPTLMEEHLQRARLKLAGADLVFGPSFDGGYYLVALGPQREGSFAPEEIIFDDISWSTAQVLEQSLERAQGVGLLSDLLGFWYDVDTFEDLKYLKFHLLQYLKSRNPGVGQFTGRLLEDASELLFPHRR